MAKDFVKEKNQDIRAVLGREYNHRGKFLAPDGSSIDTWISFLLFYALLLSDDILIFFNSELLNDKIEMLAL